MLGFNTNRPNEELPPNLVIPVEICFSDLPLEVRDIIFEGLTIVDMNNVSLVSRNWYAHALDSRCTDRIGYKILARKIYACLDPKIFPRQREELNALIENNQNMSQPANLIAIDKQIKDLIKDITSVINQLPPSVKNIIAAIVKNERKTKMIDIFGMAEIYLKLESFSRLDLFEKPKLLTELFEKALSISDSVAYKIGHKLTKQLDFNAASFVDICHKNNAPKLLIKLCNKTVNNSKKMQIVMLASTKFIDENGLNHAFEIVRRGKNCINSYQLEMRCNEIVSFCLNNNRVDKIKDFAFELGTSSDFLLLQRVEWLLEKTSFDIKNESNKKYINQNLDEAVRALINLTTKDISSAKHFRKIASYFEEIGESEKSKQISNQFLVFRSPNHSNTSSQSKDESLTSNACLEKIKSVLSREIGNLSELARPRVPHIRLSDTATVVKEEELTPQSQTIQRLFKAIHPVSRSIFFKGNPK